MAFGQDGPLSAKHHQVYIASLSRSPDERSQWKSYASQGTGVSIAFDFRGIRPPPEMTSGVSFAPCIYIDREKEHLFEEALRLWADTREEAYRQSEHIPVMRAWYQNQRSWDRFLGPSSREALFARKKINLKIFFGQRSIELHSKSSGSLHTARKESTLTRTSGVYPCRTKLARLSKTTKCISVPRRTSLPRSHPLSTSVCR